MGCWCWMWCISNNKKNSEILFLANQIVGILLWIHPILTVVLIKLCPWSFLFYFWLVPPTSCLPLLTTPLVEVGVWGFQRRRGVDTSRTCQVDGRQSRAVHCSLHSLSLSFCLSLSHSTSLSVSLTLSPLSFHPAGSCFTAARIAATLLWWWTRLIVNRKGCEI